jgi:hypothetical protein
MLTGHYPDSFYKKLADNLVYNNYEIIPSLTQVNDDKLINANLIKNGVLNQNTEAL